MIRTDWAFEFNIYTSNFNNPFIEGRAAFLCHPFLDKQALNELLASGLFGLGHDLPSLEHPLYYAEGGDVDPVVRHARELAIRYEEISEHRVFHHSFLRLKRPSTNGEIGRYYLKNLNLSSVDEPSRSGDQLDMVGRLLIVPIPLLQDSRGVACEAFFQPE